jgi:hypothetical protein
MEAPRRRTSLVSLDMSVWATPLVASCLLLTARPLWASGGSGPSDIQLQQAESIRFLETHRPQRDANLNEAFLQRNVDMALAARVASPWAQQVPWELFLNYVLPYVR